MKKQFMLVSMVLSCASPVMAGSSFETPLYNGIPALGETPASQIDHRGTQCKYAKAIASAQAGLAESDSDSVAAATKNATGVSAN